ncbi:sugar transferase [bacterium]|nr:sugar transferase [bacterium]
MIVTTFGIIIISPLLLIIALAVKLSSRGPIIFQQIRSGLDCKPFTAYKFRTMVEGAEHIGLGYEVAENDSRITKVGKFLRDTSLDELPQLFNILKGEMSLIGPRPTIPSEVAKFTERQKMRQQAKPGISGWAQVNGRNLLSWDEKIELDIWYVENWSFLLDLKILWKTIFVLLKRDELYGQDGISRAKS